MEWLCYNFIAINCAFKQTTSYNVIVINSNTNSPKIFYLADELFATTIYFFITLLNEFELMHAFVHFCK